MTPAPMVHGEINGRTTDRAPAAEFLRHGLGWRLPGARAKIHASSEMLARAAPLNLEPPGR